MDKEIPSTESAKENLKSSKGVSEKPLPDDEMMKFTAPQKPDTEFMSRYIWDSLRLSNRNSHFPSNDVSRNQLKAILLGYVSAFPKNWVGLSFEFCTDEKYKYVLLQSQNGCSGVFATVQAFLMKILIRDDLFKYCERRLVRPTAEQANKALTESIADILWQAGDKRAALAVVENEYKGFTYCVEDRLDSVTWDFYNSREKLLKAVSKNLSQYTSPASNGCLLLVLSAIISKGISRVQKEMRYTYRPLVDGRGWCTAELVHLLLTGHAVEDIFEYDPDHPRRSDVGFLQPDEQLYNCQVGSKWRRPRYPVWIVNPVRQTYSVVYCPNKELVYNWKAELYFALYYYVPENKDNPEQKLVIDSISSNDSRKTVVIPALHDCIQVKWKNSIVQYGTNT